MLYPSPIKQGKRIPRRVSAFFMLPGEISLFPTREVQNPEEDLKPEMILRVHSVAKIWEQEYQFQLKK